MKRLIPATVLLLMSTGAWASPFCGPREAIIGALSSEFREQVVGQGLSRQGPALSIYANPETGTWSAVAEFPDGTACIMDSGEEWEIVAPVLGRPS